MDRKIWFPGGEPAINSDDLQRNSQANFEALQFMFREWFQSVNENFIVAGCDLTVNPGVDATITEGYIFLNNELLKVDPQVVPFGTTDVYYYEKLTTYDPAGDKIYNDAVFRQTWQVNRGILKNSAIDPVLGTQLDARGQNWANRVKQSVTGDFVQIDAANYDAPPSIDYFKFGISGTGGSWTVTSPPADEQTNPATVLMLNIYDHIPGTGFGTVMFKDSNLVLLATYTEPTFAIWINDFGVYREFLRIPLAETKPPVLILVPSWNMQTTSLMSIPHGQPSKEAIRSASARIRNDADDELFDFAGDQGGWISWTDTNIILERRGTGSGRFNVPAFSTGGFDRGWIVIEQA